MRFMPAKTWLSIACDTAFYTIILLHGGISLPDKGIYILAISMIFVQQCTSTPFGQPFFKYVILGVFLMQGIVQF